MSSTPRSMGWDGTELGMGRGEGAAPSPAWVPRSCPSVPLCRHWHPSRRECGSFQPLLSSEPAHSLSLFSHVHFGLSAASHMPPTFPIHKTPRLARVSAQTLRAEGARHQSLPAKRIPETRKTPRVVRKYGNDVFWSAGGRKAGDALWGSGTSKWASIGSGSAHCLPSTGSGGNLSPSAQIIRPVLRASLEQSSWSLKKVGRKFLP